jgi:hypothetical protein
MRLTPSSVVGSVFVLVVGFGVSVWAQTGTPVPDALVTIQRTLATLVAGVDTITDSLTPANVRFTGVLPAAVGSNGFFNCAAVNVSAEIRTVTATLHNPGNNGATISEDTRLLQPGSAVTAVASFAEVSRPYCSMTVADGTKNDVRGSLVAVRSTGETTVLPAE